MAYLAFHNDASLAERVRQQVAAHAIADEIQQGSYWQKGKGCFIGCIAHSNSVSTVEELTGWPVMLTRIAESIFEAVSPETAKDFLPRAINSPRIGADLSLVAWKFLHWTISTSLARYADDKTQDACKDAVGVLLAKSRGEIVSVNAAANAAGAFNAARAAAGAARAAAGAFNAAYAAANAVNAAYAAANAVNAAYAVNAADAAYAAARGAYRLEQMEMLIQMLREA